ncbi:hypothetical protein [Sphingobium phenoxybenzoativorans]|uniref:hypothetical protein n=1 Tax=Sphingobium phenoxybenzoativorans TaxID=1592790 RepID=UPI001495CDA2|nr:hypothetical protein [Sphingobium phenoxybenzoativorans]
MLFWFLMLTCCAAVMVLGRSDGRIAVGMILIAVLLTDIAQHANMSWRSVNLGVMFFDVLLFIGLLCLMLKSACSWPIWMAASQSLAVEGHFATLLISQFDPKIYAAVTAGSSLICLFCMTVGVCLDHRAHKKPGLAQRRS